MCLNVKQTASYLVVQVAALTQFITSLNYLEYLILVQSLPTAPKLWPSSHHFGKKNVLQGFAVLECISIGSNWQGVKHCHLIIERHALYVLLCDHLFDSLLEQALYLLDLMRILAMSYELNDLRILQGMIQ